MNFNFFLIVVIAYFLGSIPTSVWVSKIFFKVDIRTAGSRNAGLTNIYRLLGWKATAPVAMVDLGKGILSAWLGNASNQDLVSNQNFALASGLICVFGHSYTCLAGFKGGKGVLAAMGVYLFLVPLSALAAFAVWLMVLIPIGYVSLASISAALAMVLLIFLEYQFQAASLAMLIMTILLSGFIIYRHRSNISRLLAGNESRFDRREKVRN